MGEFVGTPGPWRHCDASDGKCKCGLIWGGEVVVATVATPKCEFQDHSEYVPAIDRRMANARLIESAPDLLAACLVAEGFVVEMIALFVGADKPTALVLETIRAAIRKATA